MYNDNFPVLASDRLDYTDGAYEVNVKRASNGDAMEIHHVVLGRNLVTKLLKQSRAVFAVEVSAPYATYRRIDTAERAGKVEFTQQVSWDAGDIVPPVYVRPQVVSVVQKPFKIRLNGAHGVHKVWQRQALNIQAGTILAIDQFWRAQSTWQSLIRLVKEDTLPHGSYRVEAVTGDGFHFNVRMHPKLFQKMVSPDGDRKHCDSILTGCLSRGLEILREEFGTSDSWKEYPVLRALRHKLEQNGSKTWDVEGFAPDEVATRLRPIEFSTESSG